MTFAAAWKNALRLPGRQGKTARGMCDVNEFWTGATGQTIPTEKPSSWLLLNQCLNGMPVLASSGKPDAGSEFDLVRPAKQRMYERDS